MKNSHKNLILTVAFALSCAVSNSYAQSVEGNLVVDNISEFRLNGEINSSSDESPVASSNFVSEYKLSLGSQMLSYQRGSQVFPSEAEHIDTGFKGVSSVDVDESKIVKSGSFVEFGGSVITLNNSYEDNAIGFNENQNSTLTFSGRSGRLSLRGGYNQTAMIVESVETDSVNNSTMASVRGSIREGSANLSLDSNDKNLGTSLSSNYYLEAMYNFKPNLKGKVAFKKTLIDTFESKENVAVEGIVDATSDVSIKAGYSNEIRPEVETNVPREKKVWTEFILKF